MQLADGLDGLEESRDDLVGIGLRIGATVFEVAFVLVIDEAVGNADGGTAVGHTPVELIDRLGFVEAGESEVVIGSVRGDMFIAILVESGH